MLAILTLVAAYLGAPATVPLDAIARYAQDELEAVECLVWMGHESRFGAALSGHRWDPRAFGVMQIRDAPWLEHDPVGSVQAWLRLKHAAAKLCGDDGLAAVNSGRCDRGTVLADSRRRQAEWLDAAATWVLGRP
jgi:hypothetical protein